MYRNNGLILYLENMLDLSHVQSLVLYFSNGSVQAVKIFQSRARPTVHPPQQPCKAFVATSIQPSTTLNKRNVARRWARLYRAAFNIYGF